MDRKRRALFIFVSFRCAEDRGWSDWQAFSDCKGIPCSTGRQRRIRTCLNPPTITNRPSCDGDHMQERECAVPCIKDSHPLPTGELWSTISMHTSPSLSLFRGRFHGMVIVVRLLGHRLSVRSATTSTLVLENSTLQWRTDPRTRLCHALYQQESFLSDKTGEVLCSCVLQLDGLVGLSIRRLHVDTQPTVLAATRLSRASGRKSCVSRQSSLSTWVALVEFLSNPLIYLLSIASNQTATAAAPPSNLTLIIYSSAAIGGLLFLTLAIILFLRCCRHQQLNRRKKGKRKDKWLYNVRIRRVYLLPPLAV